MYTSDITLEKVDIVRERTGANYEEAKVALEVSNGDILEAIVYIEREKKLSSKEIYSSIDEVIDFIKDMVKRGNVTRIKISSGEKELIDIPLSAGVLATGAGYLLLTGPIFLAIVGLGAVGAATNKITIEITKADGSVQVVNKMIQDTTNSVKDKINAPELKEKFDVATKNVKESVDKIGKNVKNKADDLTKGIKGKKPENHSYTVNFDDEDED